MKNKIIDSFFKAIKGKLFV